MSPWVLGLVVLAGCDLAFPLDRPACGDHDEDGDGVFDLCDNCLGVPNPDQLDTTEDEAPGVAADGIGDACDPNPLGEDAVVFEITFSDRDESDQWLPVSTARGWRFDDESAIFEGSGPDDAVIRSLRTQPAQPFVLEYQVTTTAPPADHFTAVRFDSDQSTSEGDLERLGAECGVIHQAGTTHSVVGYVANRNHPPPHVDGDHEEALIEPLPSSAATVRITARYDLAAEARPNLSCVVEDVVTGDRATTQINQIIVPPTGQDLVLAADKAVARIDYLVIYQRR